LWGEPLARPIRFSITTINSGRKISLKYLNPATPQLLEGAKLYSMPLSGPIRKEILRALEDHIIPSLHRQEVPLGFVVLLTLPPILSHSKVE